jgi:pantoate--beta-alanine ligase
MKILSAPEAVIRWRAAIGGDRSVGLVPTMGGLHAGHQSLIRRCRAENDVCAVSLFVNPTQFNDKQDLASYPDTCEIDVAMCRAEGVDLLFTPDYDSLYPDGYRYQLVEIDISRLLCGADRPGHFEGVLSVVAKLLNLVRPQRAYFGEKDFQQLQLVKGMAAAFFIPVEIVPCPTVREADGLAMSTRNLNLSPAERRRAAEFPRLLASAGDADTVRAVLEEAGFEVDYVADFNGRRCAAVRLGAVRLIDNRRLAGEAR